MQKLALNKSVAPALEISHYLKKKLSYDCTRENNTNVQKYHGENISKT